MLAIFKRELESYFFTSIGYAVLTCLFMLSGLFFIMLSITQNTSNLIGVFNWIFSLAIFFYPIITMRLLSEERHRKTDQALLTAPIKLSSIVLGKYLAALVLHFICISITLVFSLVIMKFTMPDWSVIFGSFVGIFLVGSSIIAIGMFFSSLVENQIIAVFITLPINIFLMLMDNISNTIPFNFLSNFLKNFSFTDHYFQSFPLGILKLKDIFFFLSISIVFVFLTARVLEKRRWS